MRLGPLPGDASFEGRPVEARLLHDEMRVTSEERIVVRRLNEDLSYAENWERAIVSEELLQYTVRCFSLAISGRVTMQFDL